MPITWESLLDIGWLLFLILLFAYFWRVRRWVSQSRYWPKTKGRVISCEWTQEAHRLWPKVEYQYVVDGAEYVGEHLFLDTTHNAPNSAYARRVAYKAAHAYQNSLPIDVFYNPEDPGVSVLDTKPPAKLNFILILIAMFLILHLTRMALTFFPN